MLRFIVLAGVLAVTSTAGADPAGDFGAAGHLIIAADRVSPLLSYTRIKTDDGGGDSTTTSETSMSLLWSGAVADYYDIPRAGIDYTVAPQVTVGGTIFATIPFSASRSTTMGGTTTSRDIAKTSAIGLGGRVGYALPITPKVWFWPRGELSYTHVSTTNPTQNNGATDSSTVTQWALQLEPIFVISPVPRFGITIGPVLDLPLGGNQHDEITNNGMTVSTDTSTSQTHFGITVGMLGWL